MGAAAAVAAAALAGCAAPRSASTSGTSRTLLSDSSTYCGYIHFLAPRAPTSFESEGYVLRSALPVAPSALHDDFETVLTAYEQVQDREDGAISEDQVTLPGTQRLTQALTDIDGYTARTCGIHVAQVPPTVVDR